MLCPCSSSFLGKPHDSCNFFRNKWKQTTTAIGSTLPGAQCFKPPPLPSVLDTWLRDVQRSRVIGAGLSPAPHEPLMPGEGWTAPVARWGSGSPGEILFTWVVETCVLIGWCFRSSLVVGLCSCLRTCLLVPTAGVALSSCRPSNNRCGKKWQDQMAGPGSPKLMLKTWRPGRGSHSKMTSLCQLDRQQLFDPSAYGYQRPWWYNMPADTIPKDSNMWQSWCHSHSRLNQTSLVQQTPSWCLFQKIYLSKSNLLKGCLWYYPHQPMTPGAWLGYSADCISWITVSITVLSSLWWSTPVNGSVICIW